MAGMDDLLAQLAPLMANMGAKSPQEQMAAKVRAQQAMVGANDQAHGLDLLQFAASGANNPALAQATGTLAKQQSERYKPIAMGQTGFAIPATGDFAENPAWTEDKQMQRVGALQQTLATLMQKSADSTDRNMTLATTAQGHDQARLQSAALLAELRRGQQNQQQQNQLNTQTSQYGKLLEKTGLPAITDAAKGVAELLQKPKGGIDGIGYGMNTASAIPGVSDLVVGAEGKTNRATVQKLLNALMLTESGKAVTKNEEVRQAIANMSSNSYNEEDFRNAMSKVILPAIERHRRTAIGTVPAYVHDAFVANGGDDYRVPIYQAGNASAGVVKPAPAANDGWSVRVKP